VAGMCITLLFIPVTWQYLLTGLVLFRFFDIVKPGYIRKSEALPAGWGVMADDILAGIYSNILLQLIVHFTVK
jgi:phosphatidylglycerophosphatase A